MINRYDYYSKALPKHKQPTNNHEFRESFSTPTDLSGTDDITAVRYTNVKHIWILFKLPLRYLIQVESPKRAVSNDPPPLEIT